MIGERLHVALDGLQPRARLAVAAFAARAVIREHPCEPDEAFAQLREQIALAPDAPEHRLKVACGPLGPAAGGLAGKNVARHGVAVECGAFEHVGDAIDDRLDQVEHQRFGGRCTVGA